MLEKAALNIFGGEGPLVLEDARHQLSIEVKAENEMLAEGHMVPVMPNDPDPQHIQMHAAAARMGDPHGTFQVHIAAHMMQAEAKAKAAMMQQMAQAQAGGPGTPGGAGPGVSGRPAGAGPPQPGAQPAGPRLMKGPPGMIPPESLPRSGAVTMPRKF
jgi:hypothetical protein